MIASRKETKSSKTSRRESSESAEAVKVPKIKIKLGPKPEAKVPTDPKKSDPLSQRLVNSDSDGKKIKSMEDLVNSDSAKSGGKNRENADLVDLNHGGKSNDLELVKPSPALSPTKKGSSIASIAERLFAKTATSTAAPVSNDLESIFGPSGVPLDMTSTNESTHPTLGINSKSRDSDLALNLQAASERHAASTNLKSVEAALEHKVRI